MKRVLIVIDEACASVSLIDTYNSLYVDQPKELFYCNISLFTCGYASSAVSPGPVRQRMLGGIQNPFSAFITSSRPKAQLQAVSCADIKRIIKDHKITDVIIPYYLNDDQKNSHYLRIASAAKKTRSVNSVIGVFI